MLDADEMAAYEAWKMKKLTDSVDLSYSAFNAESEGLALAFEAGVIAAFTGATMRQNAEDVIAASPYRAKGTTGARSKRITS